MKLAARAAPHRCVTWLCLAHCNTRSQEEKLHSDLPNRKQSLGRVGDFAEHHSGVKKKKNIEARKGIQHCWRCNLYQNMSVKD
jgi:hypothetical protein